MPIAPVPTNAVKSAARALQVLELFDNAKRPLLIVEVMESLGLPQSSASSLLQTMATMGYLAYDTKTRRFSPTARVALLGNWVGSDLFRDGRLVGTMKEIAEATSDSVVLATRHDTSVRYIHAITAKGEGRLRMTVGALLPLAATGTGFALLSTYRDDEVRKIVRKINAYERSPDNPIEINELIAKLAIIRKRGYAYEEGLYNPLGAVLARPLPFKDGGLPLAITVGGTATSMSARRAELIAIVRSKVSEYLMGR